MHDGTEHGSTQVIRTIPHPTWCEAGDRPDWFRHADADGIVHLPPEQGEAHLGRTLSLDCGESFAFTVTAQLHQWFDLYADEIDVDAPSVQIVVRNNELIGAEASARLSKPEVARLIAMLQQLHDDLSYTQDLTSGSA